MKHLLLAALLLTSSAALAYDDSPTTPFDATNIEEEIIKVAWKRVPEDRLLESCNIAYKAYGVAQITYAVNGCSVWKGKTCTIITGLKTTMHTLGHEMRHCFQHDWH